MPGEAGLCGADEGRFSPPLSPAVEGLVLSDFCSVEPEEEVFSPPAPTFFSSLFTRSAPASPYEFIAVARTGPERNADNAFLLLDASAL